MIQKNTQIAQNGEGKMINIQRVYSWIRLLHSYMFFLYNFETILSLKCKCFVSRKRLIGKDLSILHYLQIEKTIQTYVFNYAHCVCIFMCLILGLRMTNKVYSYVRYFFPSPNRIITTWNFCYFKPKPLWQY